MNTTFAQRFRFYGIAYLAWIICFFILTGGFRDTHAWLNSWTQWDAEWYLRIWNEGYPRANPKALAFPPGFSLLIGSLSKLLNLNFSMTAMVVNICAYFAGLVLAVEVLTGAVAISAYRGLFLFALTSPTAYFAFAPYSDPLFVLILWAVLYLALIYPVYPGEKKAKLAEIGLLLLAPWVRLTGYALASWVLLRRWSALAVFVSLGGWLLLNFVVTGDPFYFANAQKLYAVPEGNLIDGWFAAYNGLVPPPLTNQDQWADYLQFHALPVFYFVALGLTGVWFCLGKERLIGVTILAILALTHNQSFWRAVVRYDLPIFMCLFVPIFHWSAKKNNANWAFGGGALLGMLGLGQFIMQIFCASQFKSGHWGF